MCVFQHWRIHNPPTKKVDCVLQCWNNRTSNLKGGKGFFPPFKPPITTPLFLAGKPESWQLSPGGIGGARTPQDRTTPTPFGPRLTAYTHA